MKGSPENISRRWRLMVLSVFSVVCVLSVAGMNGDFSRILHEKDSGTAAASIVHTAAQGPQLDYSAFIHGSQRHASLACTSCHERGADNSATPKFPGHKACTNCHGTSSSLRLFLCA